jgi:hypothetical protein
MSEQKEKFRWEPWNDYKPETEYLPIERPPCEHCKYWKPHRKYASHGYEGIACCCNAEMEHDFSCFKGKGERK